MNMQSNPYTYGIILTLLTYLSFGILDTIQKTAVQYHSVFVLLFVKFTFLIFFENFKEYLIDIFLRKSFPIL